METIVIELNQRDADYASKGEYRCTLATPVEVNEGDQLSFRMCSLDSNKTDVDTIIVEQDVPITAVFSYYDIDYDLRDKTMQDGVTPWAGDASGNPYFDYFAVYAEQEIFNLQTITLNIVNPTQVGYNQDQPYGGSFLFDTYTTYQFGSNRIIDPICQFRATFTYIDTNQNLQSITLTGNNAEQVGGINDNPNFRAKSDGQGGYVYNFLLFTLDGQDIATLNINYVAGTFKLASISGNWSGAQWSRSNGAYSQACQPPGNRLTGEYDTTYPVLISEISAVVQGVVVDQSLPKLVLNTFNAIVPAGRYAPEALAELLTQTFGSANGVRPYPTDANGNQTADQSYSPNNPLLVRTDDAYAEKWIFRYNNFDETVLKENITFTDANTYRYFAPTGAPASYAVGTTRFAIEFGVAGDVFQVSYMHQPITNPARVGEEDIALYYTGSPQGKLRYFPVKSASGIVFHQLEPKSFWDTQLGLSKKLVVPLAVDLNGTQFYYKSTLEQNITFGFQGLGTFLFPAPEVTPATNPVTYLNPRNMAIPPISNPVYFDVTGQSRAIIGETISINTDGGFFLIEILNTFRKKGSYIDNRESRPQISAIVSAQYDSNNSITGYSDSGIPYIHAGASYIISECTVRILNPLTKAPATNLGINNCCWIQVDKSTQPQQVKQPQPQEAHMGVQPIQVEEDPERTDAMERQKLLHKQLQGREQDATTKFITSEISAKGMEALQKMRATEAPITEKQLRDEKVVKGREILKARREKMGDTPKPAVPGTATISVDEPVTAAEPAPAYAPKKLQIKLKREPPPGYKIKPQIKLKAGLQPPPEYNISTLTQPEMLRIIRERGLSTYGFTGTTTSLESMRERFKRNMSRPVREARASTGESAGADPAKAKPKPASVSGIPAGKEPAPPEPEQSKPA